MPDTVGVTNTNLAAGDWSVAMLKAYIELLVSSIKTELKADVACNLREFQIYKTTTHDALEVQAAEYARRLEALNGEQSRIASSQATYVSREVWERVQVERSAFQSRTENYMSANADLGGFRSRVEAYMSANANADEFRKRVEGYMSANGNVSERLAALEGVRSENTGKTQHVTGMQASTIMFTAIFAALVGAAGLLVAVFRH